MSHRKLGLAVAQLGGIHLADSRASVVQRLIALMREAKARGAEMVVYPELALTTFFPRYWAPEEEVRQKYFEAQMPNPQVQPLFDEARKLGVGFYLGYAELSEEGRPYNTCILVNQQAQIVGKYRKVHLPGHSDNKPDAPFQHLEKKYFDVGDQGFKVFDNEGIKYGMCLCNDRRWPETYRVLALQSAELVVLGYNTPSHNIHWNEPAHLRTMSHLLSLQANAYFNSIWVAASGKAGSEDGFNLIGSSAIVAPSGEIVAQTVTEEDEVICTVIDLDMGENFRQHIFNFAKHRRPEHYHLIVDRVGPGDPLH